jgi:predicted peroxiredoxin
MSDGGTFGIVLVAGDHARAHAAMLVAAGAAALGRTVIMFATGLGVRGLASDWSGLEGAVADRDLVARGLPGLADLRDACRDLGVALWACPSGLAAAGIDSTALAEGVLERGLSSFLEATREGQLISF